MAAERPVQLQFHGGRGLAFDGDHDLVRPVATGTGQAEREQGAHQDFGCIHRVI